MADERNIKVHAYGGGSGVVWFVGWLFTIGFLKLAMPKALFALALWPFYLGQHFAR